MRITLSPTPPTSNNANSGAKGESDKSVSGTSRQVASNQKGCAKPEKLIALCALVSNRSKDPNPIGYYSYLYQRRILEAACAVDDNESDQALRVSKMWSELEDKLTCTSLSFDIPNGSIIKFAINSSFDEFLDDITTWKVNLNKVDEYDGGTTLDYINVQLERNRGNAIEGRLRIYYKLLRESGAKHKSELPIVRK